MFLFGDFEHIYRISKHFCCLGKCCECLGFCIMYIAEQLITYTRSSIYQGVLRIPRSCQLPVNAFPFVR